MKLMIDNPCLKTPSPIEVPIFTVSMSSLFAFTSFLGNGLALYVFTTSSSPELRTPFYMYVLQLALADLIVGVVTDPLAVVVHIYELQRHPVQSFMSYIVALHFTFFVTCSASVLFILAMTVDRFFALRYPLYHRQMRGRKQNHVVIILVWLFSIAISALYFVVGSTWMTFVFANAIAGFTLVFMFVTYFAIYRYFKHTSKEICGDQEAENQDNAVSRASWQKSQLQKKKALNVLLAMLSAFGVCYLPACVLIYYINLCNPCNCVTFHWLRDFQFIMSVMSSSINPLCYVWRLPSFQRAIAQKWRGWRNKSAPQRYPDGQQHVCNSSSQAGPSSFKESNKMTSSNTSNKTEGINKVFVQ